MLRLTGLLEQRMQHVPAGHAPRTMGLTHKARCAPYAAGCRRTMLTVPAIPRLTCGKKPANPRPQLRTAVARTDSQRRDSAANVDISIDHQLRADTVFVTPPRDRFRRISCGQSHRVSLPNRHQLITQPGPKHVVPTPRHAIAPHLTGRESRVLLSNGPRAATRQERAVVTDRQSSPRGLPRIQRGRSLEVFTLSVLQDSVGRALGTRSRRFVTLASSGRRPRRTPWRTRRFPLVEVA